MRCSGRVFPAAMLFACLTAQALASTAREVSFEERIEARRAIERILWDHRIWPDANPEPKPPFERVASEHALRQAVSRSLKLSSALVSVWRRPVRAAALQAEIDRMVRSSRQPAVLREMLGALHDDPDLVAEVLARPLLVERMARASYARDPRFHGALRARILDGLARERSIERGLLLGGEYAETVWTRREPPEQSEPLTLGPGVTQVVLTDEEWSDLIERLEFEHGGLEKLTIGLLGPLEEDDDTFSMTAVLSFDERSIRTAAVSWEKTPFDVWWEAESRRHPEAIPASASYTLPSNLNSLSSKCVDDTWSPTRPNVIPDPRTGHVALWTGSEMIVWGGRKTALPVVYYDSGGRYDPATDTWTPTSRAPGVPTGRESPTAVWTGSEMIIWGGLGPQFSRPQGGGRYDPIADAWSPTSTGPGAPAGRYGHSAVWTGAEMIVWGGDSSGTGSRYDPVSDDWTPTSMSGAPTGRSAHVAAWTGARMIVWGGSPGVPLNSVNTGGMYDPDSDSWTATSTGAGTPSPRLLSKAVWTGNAMLVWGGEGGFGLLATGGRYDPVQNVWTPMSVGVNAPMARRNHTAIWTGSEMIVWGGTNDEQFLSSGGRYDPATDSWSPINDFVNPLSLHVAVWTGEEMIVWGGENGGGDSRLGMRYDPVKDAWTTTGPPENPPLGRMQHSAVWTGSEMVVWGGFGDTRYLRTGARYFPSLDAWSALPFTAHRGSVGHSTIWTGARVILWGGGDTSSKLTGALYDPVANLWTPTTLAGAPSERSFHTAVWTGDRMIVWGGFSGGPKNTGGIYVPATDTWASTSLGANVPAPRQRHAAVWTGDRMVVWGGVDASGPVASGGRYNPITNAWSATSGVNPPSPRYGSGAIWTGDRMLLWGGTSTAGPLGDGGAYDPASNAWTPTGSTGAPAARSNHTLVWNGHEMIVWGGIGSSGSPLSTGGRYAPSTGAWRSTSLGQDSPSARSDHAAVWADEQMIVWGGWAGGSPFLSSGALYCGDPSCHAPAGTPVLTLIHDAGTTALSWTAPPEAMSYDVVLGSLTSLASSEGDFQVATGECAAARTASTQHVDTIVPIPGEGTWYLVRAVACAPGTYDEPGTGQVGQRDPEISVSSSACP